ncbi:MAG: heparinase II/III family protein [Rhizobiales bacterium]|nr:heparinase II/III family protein [Hyphomicrobiales bacterium]
MAHFSISEKFKLLFLALNFYIKDIKQKLIRFYILKWRKKSHIPNKIIFEPNDYHIADPTIAQDIYDGHISLAGISYNVGANSPFNIQPPNEGWHHELITFGWLRHFKALKSPIALMQAKALFVDWQKDDGYNHANNWSLSVTAKRLISLLSHASILIDKNISANNEAYFKIIDQHVQILSHGYKNANKSKSKLDAAIALCYAKLCLDSDYWSKNKAEEFETFLDKQLTAQILPDGGHISRNPDILLEIMLDLIPLKLAYKKQQIMVPVALQNAIDRIIPILHFFCHPDGNFIQFNGAGPTDWAAFLSIFDAEGQGLNPPTQAPHSGYYRLYAPKLQLTIDAGATPDAAYSTTAHAGPLAVEICAAGQRMVVNCGAAPIYDYKWFTLTRSTAAHSTLNINNLSTALIQLPKWLTKLIGHQIFHGHSKMPVAIGNSPKGPQVLASHNGYVKQFGLIHKRQISLSEEGDLVTGLDLLTPKSAKTKFKGKKLPFDIRFHLHPHIVTQTSRDGHSILLTLPNRDMWQFVSTFASFKLEDSIYLGESHEKKTTKQIVISGEVLDYAEVKWQFRKI